MRKLPPLRSEAGHRYVTSTPDGVRVLVLRERFMDQVIGVWFDSGDRVTLAWSRFVTEFRRVETSGDTSLPVGALL